MRVQEVRLKDGRKRYLLVDGTGKPPPEAAAFLKSLDITGKSPNTQKTYCYALKKYYLFLQEKNLQCHEIAVKDLAEFMGWMRFPYYNKPVSFLQTPPSRCSEKTANLTLSVVSNFYEYLYRNEMFEHPLSDSLMKTIFTGGSRKYKDFLYHINRDKPTIQNSLKVKEPVKKIQALNNQQVEYIYSAATNIRDRFLIKLLFETGVRIGEALALYIEDFVCNHRSGPRIKLTYRGEIINGARLKSGERVIHVSHELMNLLDDYLYEVLDDLGFDSNFVFVKLKGKRKGAPMEYTDVSALFRVLCSKTGIDVYPHLLRHTHATLFYKQTKDIKQVQERLGHKQIQTTMDMYLHYTDEDIREAWESAQDSFNLKGRR